MDDARALNEWIAVPQRPGSEPGWNDLPMTGWERLEQASGYARSLLTGERVVLRPLHEDDLSTLDAWWQQAEPMPVQREHGVPQPAGSATADLRRWSTNDSPGSVGFSVADRSSGELLGHVTLSGGALPGRCATLAIMLGGQHVGQGYGPDAVRVLVRHGFAEMGLHRIQLSTAAFNERGLAAFRTAGFVEEGRRREVTFHDGRFHDEVLMSILEPEWRASQR